MAGNRDDEETREHAISPERPPGPDTPAEPPTQAPASPGWPGPAGGQPQLPGQAWQPTTGMPPANRPSPTGWGPQPPAPTGPTPTTYWSAPTYPTSAFVVMAATMLLIFGLLISLVGALGLVFGSVFADLMRTAASQMPIFGAPSDAALNDIQNVISIIFGVVLVVGILHLLAAIGVFAHKNWARALGVLLALLGSVAGALGVYGALWFTSQDGPMTGVAAVVVFLVAYAFTLLALLFGGSHFSRRPLR